MNTLKTLLIATGIISCGAAMAMPMPRSAGMSNQGMSQANYPYHDGTWNLDPYIGGVVGLTNWTATVTDPNYSQDNYSNTKSGATGFLGHVGVMFNPFVGVEVGYVKYGNFNEVVHKKTQIFGMNGVTVDVKGVLPFGNGFNLFGKLGFASLTQTSNVKNSDNIANSGLDLGLGGGFYFTPNAEMTVSYYGTTISGQQNVSLTPSIFGVGVNMHF
jgi:hypothetical protein